MKNSLTIVLLLIVLAASGIAARADDGCCSSCGRFGRFNRADFVPNVTYYAPYPRWFPQYFGPVQSDYQVSQYVTPPAETAATVKQRIAAINAANPVLLPAPKALRSTTKLDSLPPPQK